MSRASTASLPSVRDQDIPGGYPPSESNPVVSSQQTLSEAIHARRAEFTRPHSIRIKVGTWNVAGKKGTEHDIGGWFVGGQGVSESLSGLHVSKDSAQDDDGNSEQDPRETVQEQEAGHTKKQSTIPEGDSGHIPGGQDIGLYVLGLQEVVDISSASEALRTDPATAKRWKKEIEDSLPRDYKLVAEQQLVGLLMLIYASPEVYPNVGSVSTTSVGTGLMGYMGNKGAVTTRIVLGETTRLCFVNTHLSSGLGKAELERRNWDAQQIIARTRFDPIRDSIGYVADHGEKIGDEDFCFWFGDLNYRLEGIPGDDVRRLLMLHTRNEYDVSQPARRQMEHEIASAVNPTGLEQAVRNRMRSSSEASSTSSVAPPSDASHASVDESSPTNTQTSIDEPLEPSQDPAHLQTTLASLLPHDELRQQQASRKMFHDGWREGPITFLPTYKYDVGTVGVFDSGDKKRGPSFCDRILYRTRKDRMDYENMILEEHDAKQKDEILQARGIDKAKADEDTLYDYDPEADGEDDYDENDMNPTGAPPSNVVTQAGFDDLIQLEYYISHQRVLSSDHKPLDAVFKLEYDAVVTDLKQKVHQEVVRDLDRAENEGRPIVALVVDGNEAERDSDPDGVDFGHLRFEEEKLKTITLANTGRVPAHFGFVKKPGRDTKTSSATHEWLKLYVDLPASDTAKLDSKTEKDIIESEWSQDLEKVYRIEPGDACAIRVVANIATKEVARDLNNGEMVEDILVLRVKDGRDHFLPVRGAWKQSVYGRTIDKLVRLPEGGVRKLQHQQPEGAVPESTTEEHTVMWSAPREIFRLTEAIENLSERIIAEWTMVADSSEPRPWTQFAGWPFVSESWTLEPAKRQELRVELNESLDNGEKLDKCWPDDVKPLNKLEVMSECLLLFLGSIDDGIVTADTWTRLEEVFFTKERAKMNRSMDDQRATILEILSTSSPPHSVSFVIITSMLSRIALEVANCLQETSSQSSGDSGMPASTKLHLRRKTLDHDPTIARRQLINKNLAVVFADVMIKYPEPSNSKVKYSGLDNRRELIEIFLDTGNR